MAQDKSLQVNIDKSNLAAYPDGQIQDDDGSNNGTPVARITCSDIFEFFGKLMRLAGIEFNDTYDNETNGYQYIQALFAFANKNDTLQDLNAGEAVIEGVETPVLMLPNIAIEALGLNEVLFALAVNDFAEQTQIEGSTEGVFKEVASSDAYLAGDMLMLINTLDGIEIYIYITSDNLDRLVSGLGYLKAATDEQELTGTESDVATTPETNLLAFVTRVNGADSDDYLATESQNGLLAAADKTKIDNFYEPVLNRGWAGGIDPGGGTVGQLYSHSGDISSFECIVVEPTMPNQEAYSNYLVTMANPMNNSNYFVRMFIESTGNFYQDNCLRTPVFKPIDETTFQISISEANEVTQNIKIHFEVYQYPD